MDPGAGLKTERLPGRFQVGDAEHHPVSGRKREQVDAGVRLVGRTGDLSETSRPILERNDQHLSNIDDHEIGILEHLLSPVGHIILDHQVHHPVMLPGERDGGLDVDAGGAERTPRPREPLHPAPG